MRVWKLGMVALAWIAGAGAAAAVELRAEMHRATPSGPGEAVGTVTIADSAQGAVVKTDLKGLPAGTARVSRARERLVPARDGQRRRPCRPARRAGISTRFTPARMPARRAAAISAICPSCRLPPSGTASETLTAPRITDVVDAARQGGDDPCRRRQLQRSAGAARRRRRPHRLRRAAIGITARRQPPRGSAAARRDDRRGCGPGCAGGGGG